MKDMVTNGTGNSRYLKSSLASGTSWADALAMLRAGTFPIDLAGLNNGGITQVGSAYSKANVLPESVCTALGIAESTSEPKDAFLMLDNNVKKGFIVITESMTLTTSADFSGSVHVIMFGGGGGGGGCVNSNAGTANAGGGGGSGYMEEFDVTLQPSTSYPIVIGAGGTYAGQAASPTDGADGGTTTFAGHTAAGGKGGKYGNASRGGAGGNGGSGGGGGYGANGGNGQYGGGGGSLGGTQGTGGTYGGNGGVDGTDVYFHAPNQYIHMLRQYYFPTGADAKAVASSDQAAAGGGGLGSWPTGWLVGVPYWDEYEGKWIYGGGVGNLTSGGGGGFLNRPTSIGTDWNNVYLRCGIGGGGALAGNYGGGGHGASRTSNSGSTQGGSGMPGCVIIFFRMEG